jgi:RecJ-like exonuclease
MHQLKEHHTFEEERTMSGETPEEVPPESPGAGENICRRCEGTGKIDEKICPECGGSGKLTTPIGGG